jgi:hypothetical protein
MAYAFAAHPTRYAGILFRSRLEARWAAFFDLVGWQWEYEPYDLVGWSPDFWVSFPCRHTECPPSHSLLVEVKPYLSLQEFKGHPCLDYPYGHKWGSNEDTPDASIPADAGAAFGINPHVTHWEMGHGSGGGDDCVENWISGDLDGLWAAAGERVRYQPPTKERS